MQGQLFSTDFLLRGIQETETWKGVPDAELDAFIRQLKAHYAPFTADSALNESQTEDELIEPVIDLLGWNDAWISQVNLSQSGREDVPDFLLFAEPAAKDHALKISDSARARHGVALLEAKRWLRQLDRSEESGAGNRKSRDFGTPSSQMLRYLSRADVMSDRAVKWGILTNGTIWRLYWQDARSRAEDFFEIDLAGLLGVPGVQPELDSYETRHGLKLFWLMFGRDAFNSQAWDSQRRTFHAIALSEARLYEETVSDQLGNRVFTEVFPSLCAALAVGDPEARKTTRGEYTDDYLEELREAALLLLYRLLFLFYAEDRRLLPVMDARYAPYSLSDLRDVVALARDDGKTLSSRSTRYWDILSDLFRLIADGDDAVGMPAYNGGLFENARSPVLARAKVADAQLAPVIDALSRRVEDILKPRINYRDLSVAHLGGIYERLLEYRLEEENGKLAVNKAGFARKGSGSYYTHDALVRLILDEAVGRLVGERKQAFDALLKTIHKKSSLNPPEWDALDNSDPASQFLTLKICDPAMGSGHFLVALVDWLADRVLETAQEAAESVNACGFAAHLVEQNRPWVSPVVTRIADIRRRILKAAAEHGWTVDPRQLDDRHIVRRMILKRVIFGVDKNAMAVELAKVALWLHTFTVGAPLSFLDHHLRHGDSLFGGQVRHIREELAKLKGGLLQQDDLRRVDTARMTMQAIGDLTDIDIAEAHHSKALMEQVNDGLRPLWRALDFLHAKHWAGKTEARDYQEAWVGLLNQEYGENLLESIDLLSKSGIKLFNERQRKAHAVVQQALARAAHERFLHWELAFPTVWQNEAGGFDAVIGNPPWDVLEMKENEWFAERRPQIALATNTADRQRLITELEKQGDALWQDFCAARDSSEIAARVVRECGDFPFLSSGKINLYRLFVERATALVKPDGLVGLLTPSGIVADKSSSEFFRRISMTGRLAALFDFENKKGFFPDVDSRFKFCALVFGGEQRTVSAARCAFYLHSVEEIDDPARILTLTAQDFATVNPNTGAAPIFRTRRDADITTAIYRTQPVLVDRRNETPGKVWPVRYVQGLFNMATDSPQFQRREKLESDGWYPVGMNRWKKDEVEAVPLYEGKMIQMFDHRAAHIVVNSDNTFRAAQQHPTAIAEHADTTFLAEPQYWVAATKIPTSMPASGCIAFKDVTSPTNMRTMIAAWVPYAGVGHTLPLLLPDETVTHDLYIKFTPLLLANLNCFAFDFLARQKVQGQHLMLYVLEQIPVIAPVAYEQSIGGMKIADYLRSEVLALTYTAHDLAPFARDLGYVEADGGVKPPFVWNPDDRAQRMARLDALFFHLYGIDDADADYILSTFPIVREQDIKAHGTYRTRDLIIGYLERIRSGTLSHERLV
jgi:hypothetical protein